MNPLLDFAVTTNQEMELVSGPHLLDIHTIATALENPLDIYMMSLSDAKSLLIYSNCHIVTVLTTLQTELEVKDDNRCVLLHLATLIMQLTIR